MLVPALLATVLAATPRAPAAGQDAPPVSLQEFLRRARAKETELFAHLGPEVEQLVARLEALGGAQPTSEVEKLRNDLDALGPEAAPLLVPALDPGAEAAGPARFRAHEVADALCRSAPRAVTDALVQLARSGSPDGRANAIQVLGCSPDHERAGEVLRELFGDTTGRLRDATIAALARQGGQQHLDLLASALPSGDDGTRRAVLEALAGAHATGPAPAVLALVRDTGAAAHVVEALVDYYTACPEVVDEPTLEALADLALEPSAQVSARVGLLDAMARLAKDLSPALRRKIDPIVASSTADLHEAGLVLLAALGDRNARRELLDRYDQLVAKNDRYGPAYEQRGDVLMRLGELGDAARDFKRSIDILQHDGRFVAKDLWIKLARAYARDGKPKQAYEALRDGDVGSALLAQLRTDPDFREVAEHNRYGKIFE